MKPARQARILRALGLVVLLLVCGLLGFLIWARHEPAAPMEAVTILPGPFPVPVTPRDRFAMTLGPNRRWVSRAETVLFGTRKPIDIFGDVIELHGPNLTNLESSLGLEAPTFVDTNALKIWFLNGPRLKELSQKMGKLPGCSVLSHPRIVTAEGVGSSMFMGTSIPVSGGMSDVGLHLQFVATVFDESTELLAGISHSELTAATNRPTIRTNIDVSARLSVPKGLGVLLIKYPSGGSANGYGVVVHPLQ